MMQVFAATSADTFSPNHFHMAVCTSWACCWVCHLCGLNCPDCCSYLTTTLDQLGSSSAKACKLIKDNVKSGARKFLDVDLTKRFYGVQRLADITEISMHLRRKIHKLHFDGNCFVSSIKIKTDMATMITVITSFVLVYREQPRYMVLVCIPVIPV
jgi:hypothetical protein